MIICLDFDGVVARTGDLKRAWLIERGFETASDLSMVRSSLEAAIGPSAYEEMQSEVGYEDTLAAPPVAGAIDALEQLASVATLVVVTARPPQKVVWAKRWLASNRVLGLFADILGSCGVSKIKVAANVGAGWLVDDDSRHLEVPACEINRMLFGSVPLSWNAEYFHAPDWRYARFLLEDACDTDARFRTGLKCYKVRSSPR